MTTTATTSDATKIKIKRDKKTTSLAKKTWEPPSQDEDLPDDWINNREVLVGSDPGARNLVKFPRSESHTTLITSCA